MAEESDHLLRFGVRTLPAVGGVLRTAMLVGGTPFSYGSTSDDASDPCRNSPAVTRHPIQAEDDSDMERVLILPVFKGEGGLPSSGIESVNSSSTEKDTYFLTPRNDPSNRNRTYRMQLLRESIQSSHLIAQHHYYPAIYKQQQTESEATHSEPNKDLSASTHGKMVGQRCCFVFGSLLLATIISVSLSCAFGIVEVTPGILRQDSPMYNGDTVLLSSANTFWYDEAVVHRAKGYTADDHPVHLCSVLCNRLVTNRQFYNFTSSSRHANENVIILEPTYFVSNSVVNVTLTVFNDSSPSTTLELYIFDNVSKYESFKYEKTKPSDTNARKIVRTAGYNPITTQVLFTIPQTGYYFCGLNTSAPLTFQYSYEYLKLFYNYSDYTPADCTVQDNTSVCSLPLLLSGSINSPRTCILGYTTTPTGYDASLIYLTTELHRNLWNPLSITFLVLSAMTLLITFIIGLCLCYCVCIRAGRKHGYTAIKD